MNAGTIQRDDTPIEFGGNTPSGGKFAEPWDWHGWMADPAHRGDSGFKRKPQTYYHEEGKEASAAAAAAEDAARKTRIQKEVAKCTPPDDDDDDDDDDD